MKFSFCLFSAMRVLETLIKDKRSWTTRASPTWLSLKRCRLCLIAPRSPSDTVQNRKPNACLINGTNERLVLEWCAWYSVSRAFTPKYVSRNVLSSLDSPQKSFTKPFDPGARFSTTVCITPNKWFMFFSYGAHYCSIRVQINHKGDGPT